MKKAEVLVKTGLFESFDGTSIYYEVRGQGPAIVFVYGIACLMNHWHHQVAEFSKTNTVILFDIRGHHKSDIPKNLNNCKLSSVAEDLFCLLKHLGINNIHGVGHSFGVPVLIACYDKHPEIFKSLTLINGFSRNPIKGMFGLDVVDQLFHFIKSGYEKNPTLWDQIWKVCIDNPLAIWITGAAGGFNLKLTQLKDIEIYVRGVAGIPLRPFLLLFEDMIQFDGDSVLDKIACPTLIIAGDHDSVTPFHFQKTLNEKIKRSELVIVPYGSHCSQLDFPDYINLKLRAHLDSVPI